MKNIASENFTEATDLQDNYLDPEDSSYNDNTTRYNTTIQRRSLPRHEEVQIRFNNILQKREQLKENLTGSQISYILDYYIERCFEVINWTHGETQRKELLDRMHKEYLVTIKAFIANRRKLFSIRYSNEEVYDVLVELFFEKDVDIFCKRFLNIKLNREVYLAFLERLFASKVITDVENIKHYIFYRKQYTEIKNLLLGNYIRFAFTETNKFFEGVKERSTLESKEDYFGGLILVILRVIDKYDAFKGTLTSFLENWFKDYRTTFKARQMNIDNSTNIEDEKILRECSLQQDTIEEQQANDLPFNSLLIERIITTTELSLEQLKSVILRHQQSFPSISKLLAI